MPFKKTSTLKMSLLKEYKGYYPSFESKLNFFPKAIQVKLIRKLTKKTNNDNFLSTISEISFGKLFSELGIELFICLMFWNIRYNM